jgi:hypothetical protein
LPELRWHRAEAEADMIAIFTMIVSRMTAASVCVCWVRVCHRR